MFVTCFRSWLDKNSTVLPVALYTYLRIIEDHEAPQFSSLRQLEVDFCISVLREKVFCTSTCAFEKVLNNA